VGGRDAEDIATALVILHQLPLEGSCPRQSGEAQAGEQVRVSDNLDHGGSMAEDAPG
jgi:hypothetical protein